MRRYAVLLAVSTVIVVAAPVDAQTYDSAIEDGTVHVTTLSTPRGYRNIAFMGPAGRESRRDHRAYSRYIREAADRHAVPAHLIWAVIRAESGFDSRAVSRKGARGLMQLMPRTAAILRVRDCLNPRENIDAGTRHLRALLERFDNNVLLAIAAYNAGDKVVAAYGSVPPYPETQEYVTRVMGFYSMPTELAESPAGIELDGTRLSDYLREYDLKM